MNNSTPANNRPIRALEFVLVLGLGLMSAPVHATERNSEPLTTTTSDQSEILSAKQLAIPLIASFMAVSDMPNLNSALHSGLDAGLTVSEVKEVLVQLYAYAGFPRSLNALSELMKVLGVRKQRGIQDALGREPSRAIPTGAMLILYERLPVWQEIFDIDSKGGCSLISGLFVQTRSLLTLMEFAEKALVSVTSFKGPDKHTGLLSRGPTCSAIYLISTCATY